jgi:multiple sugar transport system ATP-binding protein
MRLELANLHQSLRATMIYVTHDQVEAMTLGTKIVILDGGVLQQAGTPLEVYYHPANKFVAGFVGSPRMRFLPAQVVAADAASVKVRVAELSPAEIVIEADGGALNAGDAVEIGIRAEDLSPGAGGVTLTGTTRMIENMGHSSFWYGTLRGSDTEIVARLDKQVSVPPHADVAFSVDPADLYLFDAGGRALARRHLDRSGMALAAGRSGAGH